MLFCRFKSCRPSQGREKMDNDILNKRIEKEIADLRRRLEAALRRAEIAEENTYF
jgi:hypothetical protein